MQRGVFARSVMKRRGIPITTHNRRAFMTWAQSEGGSAKNNMLNTTLPKPGATDYNFAHVKNYPDIQTGLDATVETFDTPHQGYGKFEQAMKRNEPARKVIALIGDSSWGTGKTLMAQVLAGIAKVPGVLWALEQRQVAS